VDMDDADKTPVPSWDDLNRRYKEELDQVLDLVAQKLPRSTPAITIPVPPHIAAVWKALPAAQRASYAQAIVEAWLEPLTRMPQEEPTLVPYFTTGTQRPRPETPLPVLEALSDDDLAKLIHLAEDLLEARWPAPPLTADTAALFETDRQHPETNAALYSHDFYRWCAQTAHLARQGTLASVDPQTLASGMDDAMHHQWSALEQTLQDLLGWLLVWTYAPERREAHAWWYVRIVRYRTDLDILLRGSPVLRHKLAEDLDKAYQRACEVAADDLGWGEDGARFPATCPWRVEQIIDNAFFPEP